MSKITYEASVYSQDVDYVNFKGESKSTTLHFALDPLSLLSIVFTFEPKKSKSGNPALRGQTEAITDQEQLKFIVDLASKAAGLPSDDGEMWIPFEDFSNSLAGKTFLTQLSSNTADRYEFSEKVILDPFRAFVKFAIEDPANNDAEVAQFKKMLADMENVFKPQAKPDETFEEKKARLAAELASLDNTVQGTVVPNSEA